MNQLADILPLIQHPLALAGFGLFVLIRFLKFFLKNVALASPSKKESSRILKLTLHYGFIVSMLLILGGLFLAYKGQEKTLQTAKESVESALETLRQQALEKENELKIT